MSSTSLSQPALRVIKNYLALDFQNKIICPYKNNRRAQIRGGLRVGVGKGNPKEITEEAKIIALKKHIDIKQFDVETLTKFLVDNNLGIDCSGFAFYVLSAEVKQKKGKDLAKIIKFPFVKNPLRKLLVKMRVVQNASIKTLAHLKNSHQVDMRETKPGDMIIMSDFGPEGNRDHVLIIHKVSYLPNQQSEINNLKSIDYSHSQQWPNDGKYNHGVRQAIIKIKDNNKSLLEQDWGEKEALELAKKARNFEIRRLNVLD